MTTLNWLYHIRIRASLTRNASFIKGIDNTMSIIGHRTVVRFLIAAAKAKGSEVLSSSTSFGMVSEIKPNEGKKDRFKVVRSERS